MATQRDFPPIHPGEILLEEFLNPMGITQYRL
ncbi:MAG TPA: addiction module antidote protein, HigA family, partial [bacterium]